MSDGITEGSRMNNNIDYNSNRSEKVGELQIHITNMLISNILTEDILHQIVDKAIENYNIHRNKNIYKKLQEKING